MNADIPITMRQRLDSWKEIADYLGRDVRTAMRWEQELGLPVHRVPGGQRRGVFAISEELDAWLASRDNQLPETTPEAPAASIASTPPTPLRRPSARWYFIGAGLIFAVSVLLFLRHVHGQKQSELVLKLPNETFRFISAATISLRGSLGAIAVADLNHDGWADIVVGGSPTKRMAVLMNLGGKFEAPVFYEGCDSSVGPGIADFDGDGNLDIAIACHNTREVQVWWGDGKGSFSPITMEAGVEPLRCVPGDFNRDGIADFIADASGGGPVFVFAGHRDRIFSRTAWDAGPNAQVPFVADMDGDGQLDIALGCYSTACRNITLLRGVGDGTFKPKETLPAISMAQIPLVADLTGDNIPDVFAGSINGEESFFIGIGQGKFLPGKRALHIPSFDLPTIFTEHSRNYILDLQVYPAQFRLLSFDGQGNVTASNSVAINGDLLLSATADFNHDGRNDVAVTAMQSDNSYVIIYLQK